LALAQDCVERTNCRRFERVLRKQSELPCQRATQWDDLHAKMTPGPIQRKSTEATLSYAGVALMIVGLLMMLAALGLIFLHFLWWLRFGNWPGYTTPQLIDVVGLPYPHVAWVGVQKIIDFALQSWAATFLFFGGIVVIWLGILVPDHYEKRLSVSGQAAASAVDT
jgi:hypothetical protein